MKTFLLIFIFCLGFFLRAQETLSGNFLFLKDQGRDMLAVKSIVVGKKPTLLGPYTGLQAVFQGPLYYYLLVVPFVLFGGDPGAVMWLVLSASLAAIPIAYATGKKFFSESSGLLYAFLVAISPAAAAAATFLWSPFFVLPLMTAWLYFFLDWKKSVSKKSFVIMVSLLGLMFHFEIAFAAPFALVVLAFIIGTKKRTLILLFFAILAFFLSPLILFDLRHDFLTTRSLLSLLSGGNQGLGGGEAYGKIIYDHFIRFLLNLKAAFTEHKILSELFSIMAIFVGFGYAVFGKSMQIKTILMIPVLMYSVYLLYPFQIWDWYLVGLFPVYLLLAAIFLSRVRWRIFVIVILLFASIGKLQSLYVNPDYGGTSKIRGKIEAIDTIYKDANGAAFALSVFTPVVLTDAYDYLVWWYGGRTYGYLPDNSDILYLLIEPDQGKPWSYKGWLETEIKVGKIIETRELPSGFIIQKREV